MGGVLLKALMRFVGNFAGRNSIGRPLGARIECIVVYKNWRDPRGVVGTSFGDLAAWTGAGIRFWSGRVMG